MTTQEQLPQGYRYLATIQEQDASGKVYRVFSQLLVTTKPHLNPGDFADIEYTLDTQVFKGSPYIYSIVSAVRAP